MNEYTKEMDWLKKEIKEAAQQHTKAVNTEADTLRSELIELKSMLGEISRVVGFVSPPAKFADVVEAVRRTRLRMKDADTQRQEAEKKLCEEKLIGVSRLQETKVHTWRAAAALCARASGEIEALDDRDRPHGLDEADGFMWASRLLRAKADQVEQGRD